MTRDLNLSKDEKEFLKLFTKEELLVYCHDVINVKYAEMISILLGQQAGYTKYPCFLCLWDSRADELHYLQQEWCTRYELIP